MEQMLREIFLFSKVLQIFCNASGHFPGKFGIVLPVAEGVDPVGVGIAGSHIFGQHGFKFLSVHFPVAVFMDNMVHGGTDWLGTIHLLLGGEAEDLHAAGENILGQV